MSGVRACAVLLSVLLPSCRAARSAEDGGAGPDTGAPGAADTCRGPREPAWTADPGLCLVRYASSLDRPRGFVFAPDGDLLVVAHGSIVVLFDADGDGASGDGERAIFASHDGLEHGIAFAPDGRSVYASTASAVLRWAYRPGLRATDQEPETVVSGIPSGGHSTRTLAFDAQGWLYVSVGSAHNVDVSTRDLAARSMVRRFRPGAAPIPYRNGEVFASGLRNEVGLLWDAQGRFWGVENERDELEDERFGGDIHEDNPAEELNRLDEGAARFYGYPQCWPEGILPGGSPGRQHADQSLPSYLRRTDEWCQRATNVVPPVRTMPAHWAPLGIAQLAARGPFPAAWRGDLLIAAHGSWNRQPPTGRLIARTHVDAAGAPGDIQPILAGHDPSTPGDEWEVRPVDIHQGPDGALYFSDDAGGAVHRLGHARLGLGSAPTR